MKKKYLIIGLGALFSLFSLTFNLLYVDKIADELIEIENNNDELRFYQNASNQLTWSAKRIHDEAFDLQIKLSELQGTDNAMFPRIESRYNQLVVEESIEYLIARHGRITNNQDSTQLLWLANLWNRLKTNTTLDREQLRKVINLTNESQRLVNEEKTERVTTIAANRKRITNLKSQDRQLRSIVVILQVLGLILIFLKDVFD